MAGNSLTTCSSEICGSGAKDGLAGASGSWDCEILGAGTAGETGVFSMSLARSVGAPPAGSGGGSGVLLLLAGGFGVPIKVGEDPGGFGAVGEPSLAVTGLDSPTDELTFTESCAAATDTSGRGAGGGTVRGVVGTAFAAGSTRAGIEGDFDAVSTLTEGFGLSGCARGAVSFVFGSICWSPLVAYGIFPDEGFAVGLSGALGPLAGSVVFANSSFTGDAGFSTACGEWLCAGNGSIDAEPSGDGRVRELRRCVFFCFGSDGIGSITKNASEHLDSRFFQKQINRRARKINVKDA